MSRNTKWGIAVLVVTAALGIAGWLRLRTPDFGGRVYRIGWMLSPPFEIRGEDGKAAGLSVELVNQAARRRGISLEWVFWPESSESALRSKSVDLWPLITITPARLQAFHISEPYLQHEHCLLVRDNSLYRQISDLSTSTIGVSNPSIDIHNLHLVLPNAKPLPQPLIRRAVEDTCSGRSAATFMDKYTAVSALLNMPECGGHTLRWIGVSQIRSRLGVGATFENRAVADALRDEIGVIAREGRLATIFAKWGVMTGQDVESIEALVDARRRENLLTGAVVLFAFLFAATCWQTARLIRERTRTRRAEAELRETQERYMQAQKLESIGRLAGGVAHDFNNLLTIINGYSEIVLATLAENDALRSSISEIRKAGERASGLTQQLLAFGRKQLIQPRPLNLNTVVQDSEKMFRRLLGEDIELSVKLSAELGLVLADPGQIHQILMNLVVNARDAMPNGGCLFIETAAVEIDSNHAPGRPDIAPGPAVLLTVTDTGQGMDKKTREHIFEPFFTTKGVSRGTGLGLATVYGIVKQSRGWIQVVSEPGKGAAFQVYLPCTEETSVVETPVSTRAVPLHGSETVLVVEDQEEVRAFAVSALSTCGYRVLDAADGAQALDLSARYPGPIHILLTDVVMPGMNGRELADRIRAVRPGVAVLYTSGYTGDVIAHRGVLDSSMAYIPKPYTAGELAAKVREVLNSVT